MATRTRVCRLGWKKQILQWIVLAVLWENVRASFLHHGRRRARGHVAFVTHVATARNTQQKHAEAVTARSKQTWKKHSCLCSTIRKKEETDITAQTSSTAPILKNSPPSPPVQQTTPITSTQPQQQSAISSASRGGSTGGGVVGGGLTNAEVERYARHLVLGDVGVAGQVALKHSKVLVVGAGGLGSPVLLYLAAAGVGTLGIVDADTVDESNLQRQVIHSTSTVGSTKCQSAMERIHEINPFVKVRVYEEEFTAASALRILLDATDTDVDTNNDDNEKHQEGKWDVVVDGSDNFPTKYLINDACELTGIPWVYSAILGFEGQLSVFNFDKDSPTYRDLLPVPPPPGDVPSCAEGGVLGVLPGAMGCMQASEVLKLLLRKKDLYYKKPQKGDEEEKDKPELQKKEEEEELLVGRVLVWDAMRMKFSEVGLQKDDSRPPVTELIDYQGFCAGYKDKQSKEKAESSKEENKDDASASGRTMDEEANDEMTQHPSSKDTFHSITPSTCLAKLTQGWTPYVLDVRLHSEHDIVALPFTDAVVPHRQVRRQHVPVEGDVLVYCKKGIRGQWTCRKLAEELGVEAERLYNLEGGILQWVEEVDGSMPKY